MSTVDRVLPWRRNHETIAVELAPLLAAYRRRHPKGSIELINRAYHVAADAHQHQTRSSLERYINHPLAVARIVAEIGLDEVSLAAALLHDAVEDTEITLADVERQFGEEVAWIVDGVTKLERIQFDSKEAQQAATMRKMLVAMAKDLRVLVIKLADRLHNMRTIAGRPIEKQAATAQETLDIYAPLAHRLGIQEIKQQLEDLSFAALHPKRYAELDNLVATRSPEREVFLAQAVAEVEERLRAVGIHAVVTGRGKHLWSIYEKMVVKGREFDDIFDIVAIRIIVDSIQDCYAALGSIHGRWRPVVGRFKDYIAMPKFNLYQSLHTTVIGPGGRPIEVQIRTQEMHERAEWGVAAHWAYKDDKGDGKRPDIDWLNRMIDWQAEVSDPAEFMANLKTDLDQDEVYVFTPKGRVITLPVGATPVDFAYSVHTEVGHACIGAKVNGRLVALDHQLVSGDACEIFTSKVETAGPSQDWLQFVASNRAQNKIRQWFSRERRVDSIETGRDSLADEFRREGLPTHKIWKSDTLREVVNDFGYTDDDVFLAAVGDGHVSARSVAQRVSRSLRDDVEGDTLPSTVTERQRRTDLDHTGGIHVEGLDDVMVRLAQCCTPMPGDEAIGFVTRGRGVSVHRADCANAMSLADEQSTRLIEVEWGSAPSRDVFASQIEVVALDRTRLLRDVANSLGEQGVNILTCETLTSDDRVAKLRFTIEISNTAQLNSVLNTLKRIGSVYDVYRI